MALIYEQADKQEIWDDLDRKETQAEREVDNAKRKLNDVRNDKDIVKRRIVEIDEELPNIQGFVSLSKSVLQMYWPRPAASAGTSSDR